MDWNNAEGVAYAMGGVSIASFCLFLLMTRAIYKNIKHKVQNDPKVQKWLKDISNSEYCQKEYEKIKEKYSPKEKR